jgi:hypothetical protein
VRTPITEPQIHNGIPPANFGNALFCYKQAWGRQSTGIEKREGRSSMLFIL